MLARIVSTVVWTGIRWLRCADGSPRDGIVVGWMLGGRRAAGMAQQKADWMAAVAAKEAQSAGETV